LKLKQVLVFAHDRSIKSKESKRKQNKSRPKQVQRIATQQKQEKLHDKPRKKERSIATTIINLVALTSLWKVTARKN
jgi:hypothetical protein